MTATRDRRSDPDAEADEALIPWDERAVLGARRGVPWWGAVLLAFGLAALGAIVDYQVSDALGVLFQGIYLVGSVAAVGAVRRRNLFGPMVQPPLILAVTVPAVVLIGSGLPASSDMLSRALAIGTPLINAFPFMAITTGLTVAFGIFRMYRERDPDAQGKVRAKGTRTEDQPRAGERSTGKGKGAPAANETRQERPAKARPPEGRGDPARRSSSAAGPGTPVSGAGREGSGRRQRPDEPPRRGRERPADRDAGQSGGNPPREQAGRQPRSPGGPGPDDDRRRRVRDWPDSIPGPKRPRRTPPPGEEPPPGRPGMPRPDQGPRPPRRGRPWDDSPS
ncbi:DUF6542 domain-containing protein [Saccharomonospora sp. NPDC046836]|uniref:DUF6542 domain-containing protein n=1 Tax=Saccharomonospora sp. NPDC046836 TaxID=3156921 RepID=UPI00340ED283